MIMMQQGILLSLYSCPYAEWRTEHTFITNTWALRSTDLMESDLRHCTWAYTCASGTSVDMRSSPFSIWFKRVDKRCQQSLLWSNQAKFTRSFSAKITRFDVSEVHFGQIKWSLLGSLSAKFIRFDVSEVRFVRKERCQQSSLWSN